MYSTRVTRMAQKLHINNKKSKRKQTQQTNMTDRHAPLH